MWLNAAIFASQHCGLVVLVVAFIVYMIVRSLRRPKPAVASASQAQACAPPSRTLPGLGRFWAALPVIGGVLGTVLGFIVIGRTMEGVGDAPSGMFGFLVFPLASCLVGVAAGMTAKEARVVKMRGGTSKRLVWYSAALLLMCLFSFSVWSSVDGSVRRIRNIPAYTDLRNCRTSLAEYFSEHQRYPAALEEAQCGHADRVELTATKLTKDEYALISYHREGDQEYMIRSDSIDIFLRERNSGKEWGRK